MLNAARQDDAGTEPPAALVRPQPSPLDLLAARLWMTAKALDAVGRREAAGHLRRAVWALPGWGPNDE